MYPDMTDSTAWTAGWLALNLSVHAASPSEWAATARWTAGTGKSTHRSIGRFFFK
jgi:hypothetical protein